MKKMKCKHCGFGIEKGTNFCPNCGQKVEQKSCQYCGNGLDEEAKFCPSCGKPVTVPKPVLTCKHCGKILDKEAAFCYFCGKKVEKQVVPTQEVVEDTVKKEAPVEPEAVTTQEVVNSFSKEETSVSNEETETTSPVEPVIETPKTVAHDSLDQQYGQVEEMNANVEQTASNEEQSTMDGYQPIGQNHQTVPPIKEKKSYWRNPILWIVSVSLLAICLLLGAYMQSNPSKVASNDNNAASNKQEEQKDEKEKKLSKFKISGENSIFTNQANSNNGGYTYRYEDKLYLSIDGAIYSYDLNFSKKDKVIDEYGSYLYVDAEYIYYCDYNNNYQKVNKKTLEKEEILKDVYYVQVVNGTIYYQSNEDQERIYAYNMTSKENNKLNDENSYNITVDQESGSIFYVNDDTTLCRMDLDGQNREELISYDVMQYVYSNKTIYYSDDSGIIKYDLETKKTTDVTKKANIRYMSISDDKIIFSVYYGGIYRVDLDGKNKEAITKQKVSTFEVQGDKVIYDSNNDYSYYIIDMDGNYARISEGASLDYGIFDDSYNYDDYDDNEDSDISGAQEF